MKTLLVGLDGFDPVLTEAWMKAGRLPVLSGLASAGRFSALPSLIPPLSPSVWTSILTGVNPGRHGVFDFTVRKGHRVSLQVGFDRRAPNIFEILSIAGRKVIAVGFPGSAVKAKVSGAVLAGWDSPFSVRAGRRGCWPERLHPALVKRFGKDYLTFDAINQFSDPADVGEAVRSLKKTPYRRAALALSLCRERDLGPADLLAVYFPEADAAGHQFWHLHDPASPRRRVAAGNRFSGDPLESVYASLDAAVGILVDGYGPDAVMVVSDHGMGGSGVKALSINRALSDCGYLALKGGRSGAMADLAGRMALGAARLAPPGIRELAAARVLKGLTDASLSMMRFGGMDWDRSLAFSEDLGYAPSIWLNGRAIDGQRGQGAEPAVAGEIIEALMSHPGFSDKVTSVFRREQLYAGPYSRRIPDILLDFALDGDYSYSMVPGLFRTMKSPVETLPEYCLSGEKGGSRHGSHRGSGIFIFASDAGAGAAEAGGSMSVYDLAPLILTLHGLGTGRYFDSERSCTGPERIDVSAVRLDGPDRRMRSREADHVEGRRRLELLGYL
ncbi:MAG: alkaline phosphatase family protein [Pseudomonadota bacterium]